MIDAHGGPDVPGHDDTPADDAGVAEADRVAADARLQAAVGRGELGLAEYDERSARVWAARTGAELTELTRDSEPAGRPAVFTAATAPSAARTQHTVAVFSETTSSGAVDAGGVVAATAVLGSATIDLRRTDLPAQVFLRAVSVLGDTEVLVPRGAVVHLGGAAILGSRRADVDPADPGAPVITVSGASVLGSVTVRHGDPAEAGAATARRAGSQRRSPWAAAAAGVAVLAAGYGLTQVVTADHSTIFGSGTVQAGESGPVSIGMLFGSHRVVVPDDARVSTGGLIVFGSTECDDACAPGNTGPVISLETTGAFGSVQVLTESEAAEEGDDG